MIFRPEIEGLRAVAVIAVILFHAGFEFLPGGFLGVDVFFVISGFLITSNIQHDLANSRFSFREFYKRRVLRLFPASATTILITILLGSFLLPPDEVIDLAKSAFSALAAVSNIFFWSEVGYFDSDAHLKPLLHTWSLGVEEQFYLLWPITFVLLTRSRKKLPIFSIIIISSALSLALTHLFITTEPAAVFYLMPFRIFELGMGVALACNPSKLKLNLIYSNWLSFTGLTLLVISFTFLNSTTKMPSAYSLLPCLGAAAVIYAGNTSPLSLVLTNKVMTFIGRISYSLYLVHWPVVLFASQNSFFGVPNKLQILILCSLAAIIQFYFVEQPFRRTRRLTATISTRRSVVACALVVSLATVSAVFAITTDGFRFRLPPQLQVIPTTSEMWSKRNPTVRVNTCFLMPSQQFDDFKKDECLNMKDDAKNLLVIGDSFAADLYSALSQAYPKTNFLQATSASCRPLTTLIGDNNCTHLLQFIFNEFLPSHPIDGVILSGSWIYTDLDMIDDTINHLRSLTPNIILAGPTVRFHKNVPSLIFDSRGLNVQAVERYVYSKRHGADVVNDMLLHRFSKAVKFINLHELLCLDGCRVFTQKGELIFVDFGHLTAAGATFLAERINASHPDMF